jgi:hypothetical protein
MKSLTFRYIAIAAVFTVLLVTGFMSFGERLGLLKGAILTDANIRTVQNEITLAYRFLNTPPLDCERIRQLIERFTMHKKSLEDTLKQRQNALEKLQQESERNRQKNYTGSIRDTQVTLKSIVAMQVDTQGILDQLLLAKENCPKPIVLKSPSINSEPSLIYYFAHLYWVFCSEDKWLTSAPRSPSSQPGGLPPGLIFTGENLPLFNDLNTIARSQLPCPEKLDALVALQAKARALRDRSQNPLVGILSGLPGARTENAVSDIHDLLFYIAEEIDKCNPPQPGIDDPVELGDGEEIL